MIIYIYLPGFEKGIRTKGLGSLPNPKKDNELKEEGKFPIGTIRHWVEGDVIKRTDTEWVPIEIPDDYYYRGEECSKYINSIFNNRDIPIKRQILIDHLLKQYFEEYELAKGEFKKYKGFSIDVDYYTFHKGIQQMWVSNWINEDNQAQISVEKLTKLRDELKQIDERFKQPQLGLNDVDYKVYKGIMDRAKTISETYIKLPLMLKFIHSLKKTGIKFKDDFVINEAIASALEENFIEYKKKYEQEIIKDEGERQITDAGLTLSSPNKEFYSKMKNRFDLTEEEKEIGLLEEDKKEYINYALKARLEHMIEKKLEGKNLWDRYTIFAVANFENFVLHLPLGHVLNNDYLQKLTNHSYSGVRGNSEGYAFYSKKEKEISLSDSALSNTSVIGNLTEPNEFNSVITHEIGHAVANKLRDLDNLEYKRFIMYSGWDNRQGRKMDFNATHGSKQIPRHGTHNDKELLTKYSYQSPNECFAEYYSFYFINKDKLNKWLETGNKEELLKYSKGQIDPADKKSFIARNLGKLTKKVPIYHKIVINRKTKIETTYEDVYLTEKELDKIFEDNRLGHMYYRNEPILVSKIIKQYLPLKQMKEKIFENEKLIKALIALGVL